MQHMMVYGQGNIRRLLSPDAGRQHLGFTWGLEQKSASVCIPHSVLLQQQGHLEDRRPGQCLLCAAQCMPPVTVEAWQDTSAKTQTSWRGYLLPTLQ